MIPDPHHVSTLTSMICSQLTATGGWDQAPALYSIHVSDRPIQGIADPHLVDVRPLPIPEVAWQGEPGVCLLNLAINLAWLLPEEYVDLLMDYADPTFAGYLFMVETWHGTQAPPPGLGLADVPGSVECRTGVAVDTAGNVYQVTQERGGDPAVEFFPIHEDEGDQVGGRIVNALRLMTLAACERLPADAHAMPKLLCPEIGVETSVEEMLRQMGFQIPDVCSCTDSGDPALHREPIAPKLFDPSLN